MRYAYKDLHTQPRGSEVIVRWSGAAADVLLLDPVNFVKYCEGRDPVMYGAGGHASRSPARLTIPEDGRWYVVADLRGYSTLAQATVQVVKPGEPAEREPKEEAVLTLG
ncbi:MAG TPA: DUF1883 domain-containing protein [Solirubrobacteraceae bacterium]|jgi:hypothetical protein